MKAVFIETSGFTEWLEEYLPDDLAADEKKLLSEMVRELRAQAAMRRSKKAAKKGKKS